MPEPIVTLNEESLRSDLRELAGKTVEDTLNGPLEAEADELVGAGRHGRTAEREAYRAGHCDRGPATSSGEVAIHMPKLKGARLATAAIERHRRREAGVEEAMIEMHLAGVSTRGIEDVSEIPLGVRRLGGDRPRPQREGVRPGRGMAEPPARARPPLRLRRRHIPEAQLGRGLRERRRHDRRRRQRRRPPRGHRRR